jgi:putative glutamine amidotransferase
MNIALSKGSGSPKYAFYAQWLRACEPTVEVVDLASDGYYTARAVEQLQQCAGIVFTGGSDLEPSRYGAEHERDRCGTIDPERDAFELELFRVAHERRMPILGICRGLQLINVALGGSLIVDIPSDRPSDVVHTRTDDADSEHWIAVEVGSLLGKMLRHWEGTVNSAHHQAIDRLGDHLRVAAVAPDGIVEAIESDSPEEHGFLFAVQWHPERMRDRSLPFSRVLAERFLFECTSYALLLQGRMYDREQFMAPPTSSDDGV